MTQMFDVAIVGAGPGGLSAAAHAAELGVSHVLLEASSHYADTIQKYQKGKHVMAEPSVLPLRSAMAFQAGTREAVLSAWQDNIQQRGINLELDAGIGGIGGCPGAFQLDVVGGGTVNAAHVVLAIGVQGNPRKLGVAGEDSNRVQYQLDDPDAFRDETIVIVGAGDAAIENALALAPHNRVVIVNRRDEFARAKEGNLQLILQAIDAGRVECLYGTTVNRVDAGSAKRCAIVLDALRGDAAVDCDRIIARLGATPQRLLVESFGIQFPNDDPNAVPALSSHYESNVEGIYVIGALAGYPLIKQAMNQGYEVIEYILGNAVRPADHPLLEESFQCLPWDLDVDAVLTRLQQRQPLFEELNALMFREMMLGSTVWTPSSGDVIFERNDYSNSFFSVVQGNVLIDVGERPLSVEAGDFFGEMGLISGRRRSATVWAGDDCILIETSRRTMNKLINSVESVRRVVDETFILKTIRQRFAPEVALEELKPIAASAKLQQYAPDEVIFNEGDPADSLHVIRSGSVVVANNINGREIPISYVAAGNYVGEMGLLGGSQRSATVRATVKTETVSIGADAFLSLIAKQPDLLDRMQKEIKRRVEANVRHAADREAGDLLSFLMRQGLGEATDVLLIDESLCIGCDHCESACAETHGGTSRLRRKAGPTYANIHVPTSCRHCEDPHCMKDCPPDAIHRGPGGEVYIDDSCIGCGNCEENCPYGVIQMSEGHRDPSGFWKWLLLGLGPEPGVAVAHDPSANEQKKAVKCDMCVDLPGGAACVRACPTGAALRLGPEQFGDVLRRERR